MSKTLQSTPVYVKPRSMKYQTTPLKLEQLVSYFKDHVIDLTPAFQRGRVWSLKLRKGLLKNILQGKPVPAIFLYKKPSGSKNFYIILDGKQRLTGVRDGKAQPSNIVQRLLAFDALISSNGNGAPNETILDDVKKYIGLSAKQTTDANKRKSRQALFTKIIRGL